MTVCSKQRVCWLDPMDTDELIGWYFSLGYTYQVIICFLYYVHGICLSLRQLKRILKRLNLRRRRYPINASVLDGALEIMKVSSANLPDLSAIKRIIL